MAEERALELEVFLPSEEAISPGKRIHYSRLPITRTVKGNRKKVPVIGSLKQITGSKEISEWMGRKGN